MKDEILKLLEEFNLDDCIFLESEVDKEDWNEVYACAEHISGICMGICRIIEENED